MEALSIIREHYRDFGPTLAREKLEEVHGLVLGKETIRRLMINAGLWIPRRQRAPKIHQPRYRRPCTGELLVRALLARTYTFASQSLVKQELPYDFEMLKNIAEQDNVLAKLYGIAELNNGQALNASYPYTISELAKLLDMGSWHYVHKVLERIHKETGFNIKSSDNNYHVLVKTGKEGVHKYSPAAFELIKKIINGQKYKLKP